MKAQILVLSLVLTCVTVAQTQPQEIHCKHFFKGYPSGAPASNDLIIRDTYALSNNDTTKFADWVAYRLTMHEVDGELDLARDWKKDPWLDSTETLEPEDYEGAANALDIDRGHLAPLGSFVGSRFASQTDFLSNITPQNKSLNRGVWKKLEDKVRDIVKKGKTVYVMTGTLYDSTMSPLPHADEKHTIPSGYWKIVTVIEGNSFNTAAFIFKQNTQETNLMNHLTTIDNIEALSGLDFFWELDGTTENALESDMHQQWANGYFN